MSRVYTNEELSQKVDINVGQISEALNDKADRDLNNVTPPLFTKKIRK